jgi:hypothetical protein
MIKFKFRASAFGWHYYDCITPTEVFEIRHAGYDKLPAPAIEPHWSGEITPEIRAAWEADCARKDAEYHAWRRSMAERGIVLD